MLNISKVLSILRRGVLGKRTKKVEEAVIDVAGHVYISSLKICTFHQGIQILKKPISFLIASGYTPWWSTEYLGRAKVG